MLSFMVFIYIHKENISILSVIDLNKEKKISTSFGTTLVGSVLNKECRLRPSGFDIYFNLLDQNKYMYNIISFHLRRPRKDILRTLLI